MSERFTESVVEDAALAWLEALNYSVLNSLEIAPGELAEERSSYNEVVLRKRLEAALHKLNPTLKAEVLQEALRQVTVAGFPALIGNNHAFHRMIVDGIAAEAQRDDGSIGAEIVRLIDFENPEANDWLAVNQFTVLEGQHTRRPDILIFVNGLPLVMIELKNAAGENADVWSAFRQLQTYKAQIPLMLSYDTVLVISDGLDARIGTISADSERFMPWRTIGGETIAPPTIPQLEVLVRGVFDQRRFLNLIRHFLVFEDDGSTVTKKWQGITSFMPSTQR